MPISPTAEGFRAAFRRPSFTMGEIIWRWSIGATASALFFFGFFEFLDTLPVTNGEMLLLRTRHPYLVGQVLTRILRGSEGRAILSLALAALLIAWLWMIAASLGRIVTVNAAVEYFRTRFPRDADKSADFGEREVAGGISPFGSLVRLNFLRLVVVLAAMVGFVGAGILAGFASPVTDPHPELAFLLFLPLAALIALVWSALNWLLSLAGMFAVRRREHAIDAILSAIAFFRERTGAVLAVSTWTGLAHVVAFGAATTVVGFPMGLAGVLPGRLVLVAVILVTVAYFAVVDWLYMARLAGYICIAELPEALLKPLPPAPPAPPVPLRTSIDRDELILSDVPGLILQS